MSELLRLGIFNRQGMQAMNDGRFDDALFQLFQAKAIAGRMKTPLHSAKVHNNMGLVNMQAGRPEDAEKNFRLAEKFAVDGAGEGNCLHRTILRNLSQLDGIESKAA
jgi:hypothetical protein